jgi:hypothetical protein
VESLYLLNGFRCLNWLCRIYAQATGSQLLKTILTISVAGCSLIRLFLKYCYFLNNDNIAFKCTSYYATSSLPIFLLLLLTPNGFIQGGSVIQCKTGKYNTITKNNVQYWRQPSIRKITENQEHTLCTIKTQKRVETKVDESVLQTTRYTKQSVNHTILYYTVLYYTTLHYNILYYTILYYYYYCTILYYTALNYTHFTKTFTSLHLTTLIYTSYPTPP